MPWFEAVSSRRRRWTTAFSTVVPEDPPSHNCLRSLRLRCFQNPRKKLTPVSLHGETLHNPYAWMASLSDTVAMRQMDLHMDQEEKYCEAALASLDADKLVRKLQIELAPRLASDLRMPPLRFV